MQTLLSEHSGNSKFKYMLLSRMQSDCNYFLGNGGKNEKCLWSGSVKDHIDDMKSLYLSFYEEDRPEWLTMTMINEYAEKMTAAD
jgi:hypothetical protein